LFPRRLRRLSPVLRRPRLSRFTLLPRVPLLARPRTPRGVVRASRVAPRLGRLGASAPFASSRATGERIEDLLGNDPPREHGTPLERDVLDRHGQPVTEVDAISAAFSDHAELSVVDAIM